MSRLSVLTLLLIATFPYSAWAESTQPVVVDSVWVITATALVFFMQAGFALLESGMARAKNAVNVMMKNYMDICIGSLFFWAFGFGLMFGNNPTGLFGTTHFAPSDASHWEYTFLVFQMMFAATAVTICSGAMAERTQYASYLAAACVIIAVIYPVFGSWVWGGTYGGSGWLADMGFIDFAGSTVVHSIGAWCALAGVMVVGPRTGRFSSTGISREIPGHSLTLVALGGFILWLGWFGFNGGSTLEASTDIGKIVLNTHLSASAGAAGALLYCKLRGKPILLTVIVNGSLAGLVGITAGCATMTPLFAVITGLISGVISVLGVAVMERWRLDDVVSAVPVHGFAGIWGTLAAGLFFSGDLFSPERFAVQSLGVISAFVWAFPLSYGVFYLIKLTIGLRSSRQHEQIGLDYTEHNEIGYPEFQKTITYHKES